MKKLYGVRRKRNMSDADFLQAVIDANPSTDLHIPSGTFLIDKPIVINNNASLTMNSDTVLIAVAEMDFVLTYQGNFNSPTEGKITPPYWKEIILDKASLAIGRAVADAGKHITGGVIDGNGMASCLYINGFGHFTVRETNCLNGKKYGFYVGGGVEMVASNMYIRCTMSGLAGNIGLYTNSGDNHYEDIIVIDHTIGIYLDNYDAGANRLFRCHVWGGPVPALPGENECEYLKNSIGFKIVSGENVLRDCYADTSKIGFDVHNWTRMFGCAYYNNYNVFGLDDVTIIKKHNDDPLTITGCFLKKSCPACTLFAGDETNIIWRDNTLFDLEQPPFAQGGITFFLPPDHPDVQYAR